MEITKKLVEDRKAVLQLDADRMATHLQAIHGAIQDCDFWLAKLEEKEPEEALHGDQ